MKENSPALSEKIAPPVGAKLNERQQRSIFELVSEMCREGEARADGLEPAEAEALANALLRAFGQNEEYPCLLEDPVPRDNMIPAGGPAEENLVETEAPAQVAPSEDPLLLLVRALTSTTNGRLTLRPQAAASPSPAIPPVGRDDLGRGENGSNDNDGGRLEACPTTSSSAAQQQLGREENDQRQRRGAEGQKREKMNHSESAGNESAPHHTRLYCAVAPHLLPIVSGLLVEAYLTPRQRQVARLILWGWEPKEIASKLGIAASTVRKLWSRARKPLGEALIKMALTRAREEEENPVSAAELREIYLEEVGRFAYRPPRHCPAGKERCKNTGVCEFALPAAHLVAAAQRE